MIIASVLVAAVLGLGPGDETSELVTKLGSSRAAERDEAAAQLLKHGRDALPALREAVKSKNPDLHERAAGLIEKIDQGLMLQPTLIKLDERERPLDEVVKSLGEQAGVAIRLEPENAPAGSSRKVTLQEPHPVPFWTALDRLCRAGELRYDANANVEIRGQGGMVFRGEGMVFRLYTGPANASPTSDHGPFRVQVAQLFHMRDILTDKNGVPGRLAEGMAPGGMRPGPVGAEVPGSRHEAARLRPGSISDHRPVLHQSASPLRAPAEIQPEP